MGMTVILVLVGYKLLELVVSYFWKKFTRAADNEAHYVTADDCKNCRAECHAFRKQERDGQATALNDFKKEVRESFGMLKGFLIVIAAKDKDIDPQKLAELVK